MGPSVFEGEGGGLRKVLLACGAVSALLYVSSDIAAALSWEGYSYRSMSISELMGRGAPTRPFLVATFVPNNLLVTAFGIGILLAARGRRALRFTAWMLIAHAMAGFLGLLAFPLPPPEVISQAHPAVIRHEVSTGVVVLCLMLAIGFGGAVRGGTFLLYSIATIVLSILFGVLTSLDVPLREATGTAPWMGIKERISVYSTMLWILLFSIALLKEERGRGAS